MTAVKSVKDIFILIFNIFHICYLDFTIDKDSSLYFEKKLINKTDLNQFKEHNQGIHTTS